MRVIRVLSDENLQRNHDSVPGSLCVDTRRLTPYRKQPCCDVGMNPRAMVFSPLENIQNSLMKAKQKGMQSTSTPRHVGEEALFPHRVSTSTIRTSTTYSRHSLDIHMCAVWL
jgi:hypothetical protein